MRYSMRLVADVKFAPDCIGDEARKVVTELSDGQCALLENLRFHPGEKENDAEFGDALASWRISTSTTPSRPPTGRTRRSSGWRKGCHRPRAG